MAVGCGRVGQRFFGMGLHAPAHGISLVDGRHRSWRARDRALTVGQVETALADAQEAALEALDAGRVTSIAELEGEFRGLIQRVVDAVDIEQEGEPGSLALDVLVERVSATKEGLIEAQDFQQAASLRDLERQFHRMLGDIYAALRDARSS